MFVRKLLPCVSNSDYVTCHTPLGGAGCDRHFGLDPSTFLALCPPPAFLHSLVPPDLSFPFLPLFTHAGMAKASSSSAHTYQPVPTPARGTTRVMDGEDGGLLASDSEQQQRVASYSRPFQREPSANVSHSNLIQPGKGTSTMHSYSTGTHSTISANAIPRFLGTYHSTSRGSASDLSVHSSSQLSSASSFGGEKAAFVSATAKRGARPGPGAAGEGKKMTGCMSHHPSTFRIHTRLEAGCAGF